MRRPLHIAVHQGNFQLVELLINRGALLDRRGEAKYTPLQICVVQGAVAIAKLLMSAGADKAVKDDHGNGLLHLAVGTGKLPIIDFLVKYAGFDALETNDVGATAAEWAWACGHTRVRITHASLSNKHNF